MVNFNTPQIIAALGLVGSSAAHMIMNTPTPYNLHKLQTSPLGPATGGQVAVPFPCHGNFSITEITNVTAGSTQTVKFTGSAIHGGGSCQFSVNYGDQPSDDPSKWKVIYSIIGGCPADAQGNIEGSAPNDEDGRPDGRKCGNSFGKECVRQFDIPIPKGLPNGRFSFGWTWFNKIGNREMYMNCAPMVMTGGSDSNGTAFLDSLPPIFVANVAGLAQCTTNDGILNVPNPGRAGVLLAEPAADSEGTCPKSDGPNFDKSISGTLGSQGSSGSGSPSGSSSSLDSVPPTTFSYRPMPSSSSTLELPQTVIPVTLHTVTTSPSSSAAPVATGASGPVPCSEEGALICLDPGYFGICDHGAAVRMELAAGTTCQDGKVVRRSV